MQRVKAGSDFTGYLLLRHPKCGATKRVYVGTGFLRGFGPDGRTGTYEAEYEDAYVTETKAGYRYRVLVTRCACGAELDLDFGRPVYGRMVTEVICSAKCRNAVGPSCDCECGGLHHGENHGGRHE